MARFNCDPPHGVPEPMRAGFHRLQCELGIPERFAPDAEAEAGRRASGAAWPERDATDVEFVTIDPPGARDLDQAVHLARRPSGYLVRYAIADLAAFVEPGGAIDREAHERGVTLYAPHHRTPLHPPVLSEGAASLLPGEVRPALLWELELDEAGHVTDAAVVRARVRSRRQLTYAEVQEALDAGSAPESLSLLREIGQLREEIELRRGGVSLPVPEQEVRVEGRHWTLEFRSSLPVEGWNAQVSLMTGMAAASIMRDAGIGILRTLPPAEQWAIDRLRRVAKALRIRWPGSLTYPEFVRSLDPTRADHAAMLNACTRLFRGAGYEAFAGSQPEQPLHAALATEYAHCTAPLRRLVDRYVGEICVAACAGTAVPGWVAEELPGLPDMMAQANARAGKFERGIVNLVEALVLADRVGEEFLATVIDYDPERGRGEVQLTDPAVEARLEGRGVRLGTEVPAVLTEADLLEGKVLFQPAGSGPRVPESVVRPERVGPGGDRD